MIANRRLLSALSMLVLSGSVAACSSSTKSASPSTTASPTEAGGSSSTAPSGSPIKVAEICSCSGAYGTLDTASADVFQAWVKSTNASGGLSGHPVEVVSFDDAGNPGTSTTDLQSAISGHAAAILDLSAVDSAWAKTAEAAKIPVIGGIFSEEPFITNPDFYPSGQTEDSAISAIAAVAKRAEATSVGLGYCAEAVLCQQLVPQAKGAFQHVGLPLTYSTSVSATASNYTAQCVAAQQAKVSALFIVVTYQTLINIGTDCNRQGYDPIYLIEGGSYTDSLAAAPGVGKDLWAAMAVMPYWANTPGVQAMNAAVARYYPGLEQGKGGAWTEAVVGAWTGGLLIRDAVKGSGVDASGTVDAAAMTQGLDSIKGDTLDGMSPPLTFSAGKAHPVDCWFVAKVVDGKPSLLDNGQTTCQNAAA